MPIRSFSDRWPQYNRRLTEIVSAMSTEQLAISPAPDRPPIWATVRHHCGELSQTLGIRGLPQIDLWRPD
jgi:hypothetical protein